MPPRFTEKWVPFSLAELSPDESIPLRDPEEFVPYLTEKWPKGGRPHRVELQRDRRSNPKGVDGWLVFRVPPPEPDPTTTTKVRIDWSLLRPKPPTKKRKKSE